MGSRWRASSRAIAMLGQVLSLGGGSGDEEIRVDLKEI